MKRLLALLLAAAAPAFAADAPRATWKKLDATLEPRKMLEFCAKLTAGEQRRFHWKSSAAVDFNIHHHEGSEPIYAMKREAMRGDGGTFTAKAEQEYCWMWTARNAKARVEAQVEIGDAPRSP
jgi:hypothetical protein